MIGKKKSPQLSPGAVKKEVVGSKTYLESGKYAGLNSVIEASDVLPGISDATVNSYWKAQLVSDRPYCYALIASKVY